MTHTPEDLQIANVISSMGKQAPVDRALGVEILSFTFHSSLTSKVGVARHIKDPQVAIVFSLGTLSRKVFLMVVDGYASEFAYVVARLEHKDMTENPLRIGSCFEMSDSAVAEKLGWVAFQLLRVEDTGATIGFPQQLTTGVGSFEILWGVPLSRDDLKLSKEKGLEALLDYFISTHRDVVGVSPRDASHTP